jgi:hypothetical protein
VEDERRSLNAVNNNDDDGTFRDRDLSELIDEDKREFVRRRCWACFWGGYRTVYDD